MRQKMTMTKLTILSILVGSIYFVMLLIGIIPHVESFVEGFKEGGRMAANTRQEEVVEYEPALPISIPLHAEKHDRYHAPDTLYNGRVAKSQPVIIEKATVYYPQKEMPGSLVIAYYLIALPFFAFVAFTILIPIKFVETMMSISKGDIFTIKNVKRLRLIGIYLLSIFLLALGMNAFDYYANSVLFQFEGYRLEMSYPDLMWIFLCGISFLLAEVLEKAARLKEEQDLTI